MEVYKFGGASVKDAPSVANVADIIAQGPKPLVVVVSAMGKVTDMLELVANAYYLRQPVQEHMQRLEQFHFSLIDALAISQAQKADIRASIQVFFDKMYDRLSFHPFHSYDFHYDQLVSFGELISSRIVAAYLQAVGFDCAWLDIRQGIITDKSYRWAKIDWELSTQYLRRLVETNASQVLITQGFIGGNLEGHTTTLGRDGSDYTASILAHILDAERVTVWKDVDGVYNADPKWYPNFRKLEKMSYAEAIELAFFGAQIIHPKTIKPLQNKRIPFYVKSFLHRHNPGTLVNDGLQYTELPPIFIRKTNQVLISVQPTDFSFIMEDNLSKIFGVFAELGIKIHLMQNAAISFSACFNFEEKKLTDLLARLKQEFKVRYNTGLELITIRHFTKEAIAEMTEGKDIFIQQRSRKTVRFVLKSPETQGIKG